MKILAQHTHGWRNMVQKSNKEKNQSSPKREANTNTIPRPWPNLPKELTTIISSEPGLMENISFGGVVKSWRSTQSRKCSHTIWPQLTETQQKKNHSHCLHIRLKKGYYCPYGRRWRTWKDNPIYIKAHSHGVLIFSKIYSDATFYWKSYTDTLCNLPTWDPCIPFKLATLATFHSRHYGENSIVMVLTGASSPAFVFCNMKGCVWTKQDCNLTDPFGSGEHLQFINAIGFNGKFYALSLQGTLAVIEVNDSRLEVTELSSIRAVPSVISKQFKEVLIESDGEILLIFLISKGSIEVVDDVDVYKLDIQKLSWLKMESIGHRTLFVEDECCMWINASKMGCRSNCIYFNQQTGGAWWMFDMQSKVISPAPI